MSTSPIQLKLLGPFPLYDKSGNSVFEQKEVADSGIYLFAVAHGDGYLVDYVGETGQSFRKRLSEHARGYLGGEYRIYEASNYTSIDNKLVWGGTWLRDRRNCMGEFIARYEELAPLILEYIKLFQIFLAPVELDDRMRQRVESSIALNLYNQPGLIGNFQASETKKSYRPRRENEIPVRITIQSPVKVLGLPSELEA